MTPETLDPESLRLSLEAAGWRCTRQRMAVYEHLALSTPSHPTAEDVFQSVRKAVPNISLATVYKALEVLVASNVATKLASTDGSSRYDARADRHYHIRDLRSGQVRDLPAEYDPSLIEKLDPDLIERLRNQGFQMTGYRLELLGYFSESDLVS